MTMEIKTTIAAQEKSAELIRRQILDAAEARFQAYGYGKTTMAEIASDLNMSAANLYRYFENKLDIGSALAQRCFTVRREVLENVVNQPLGAAQKLEHFVLTVLHLNFEQFSAQPKLFDLVETIVMKRLDLVQQKVHSDHELIMRILQQGNANGEFTVADVATIAEAVQSAIVKFSTPFFMTIYSLEEFERVARNVVQLLVNGLVKN